MAKKKGNKANKLEGDIISKVIMNRNRDKDFVQRAYAVGEYPESNMFTAPGSEFNSRSSHLMAYGTDDRGQTYMFPTILNENNEAVKVPNQYADYISSKGYKNATGMGTYQQGTQNIMPNDNPYNELISYISKKKKVNPDNIGKMLDLIGMQESNLKNIAQIGGGPGRGYYQFEPDSLKTATTRLKNLYKAMGKEVPTDIVNTVKESNYDATKLSKETQDALALADMYMRPNFDFKTATTDLQKLPEVWKKGWNTRKDDEGLDRFQQNIERTGTEYIPYSNPDKPLSLRMKQAQTTAEAPEKFM
jgi:hypothetical protein